MLVGDVDQAGAALELPCARHGGRRQVDVQVLAGERLRHVQRQLGGDPLAAVGEPGAPDMEVDRALAG